MMSEPFFMTLYKTRKDNRFLPKSRYNCGCYTCCKIFSPKEITTWIEDKYAVCPHCDNPTIVGEITFESVDPQILDKINRYYVKKECVDGYTPAEYTYDDSPWICPVCKAEVKGGLYCFTCGTRNPNAIKDELNTAKDPVSWICPNCGTAVKSAHFCPECGTEKI